MNGPSIDDLLRVLRETDGGSPARNSKPDPVPLVEQPLVDIPSSETSTRGLSTAGVASTPGITSSAGRPSTAGEPSTAGVRRFEGWAVNRFAQGLGYAPAFERRLTVPELWTFGLRLEVESGRASPIKVDAALPDGVSGVVLAVAGGFLYLLSCRWLKDYGDPAPYTRDFAAAWCGVSVDQARDARKTLVDRGWLVHVGHHGRMKLWLPAGLERETA